MGVRYSYSGAMDESAAGVCGGKEEERGRGRATQVGLESAWLGTARSDSPPDSSQNPMRVVMSLSQTVLV